MKNPAKIATTLALLTSMSAAQVIINEVHSNGQSITPPNTLTGDYVELWNQGSTAVNIGGWTFGMWSGNTGAASSVTIPANTFVYGNCFFVLSEFGTLGSPLIDAPLTGLRGMQIGIGTPWASNSSVGAFLKNGTVNMDYVYLYRGTASGLPVIPPNSAAAGTGVVWTIGAVATSGANNGHQKRTSNADGSTFADWTQDQTINFGTPGAINTTGGAAQTSLGTCIPPYNFDYCEGGQPNSALATMTMGGTLNSTSPFMAEIYTDNEPLSFNVSSTTLLGSSFFLFASGNCNVGHLNDGAGSSMDLGFSGGGFCDVDAVIPGLVANLCGGGPFLPFAALDGSGNFSLSLPIPGIAFPKLFFQSAIIDGTAPFLVRTTAATGLQAKLGARYAGGSSLPLAIPDGVGGPAAGPTVTSDIVVASGSTISDLNVVVFINHTWMGDVTLTLTHVDTGTTVNLLTTATPDSSSDLVGRYEFSDEAAMSMDAAATPLPTFIPVGVYGPDSPLSLFDGEASTGTWRLSANDNFNVDTGTIVDWFILTNTST